MSTSTDSTPAMATSGVVAAFCLAAAFCLVVASNILDQQRSIASLQKVQQEQTAAIAASHKAEDQLTALANGTQALADKGNANAAAVVAVLQRNGVKIKPNP